MTAPQSIPRRILIAEDDRVSRRLLQSSLEKWGYQVIAVADGFEALRELEGDAAPSLAILDWMMPGKDGPQVCARVRALTGRSYIYILLLTSRSEKDDLLAGLESGADDYLTKPFNPAELRARLQVGLRILELQTSLVRAKEELYFRATHDELTGLVNRRVLIETIARENAKHHRLGEDFAIIILDLDHFKSVNDTHGHLIGDAVLKETARRMVDGVRPYDTVGRYGGEEFIIVAPSCDLTGAGHLAQRLLQSIRSAPIESSGPRVTVTASCGVSATQAGKPLDAQTLVRLADEALYRAKENGRDRAEFAAEPALMKSG